MARDSRFFSAGRYQRGLSLVELMVSLLLGLVLASGIVSVYLESKRNFAADEELARIQENGRFALSLLKRELMLAGFYGGYLDFDDLAIVSVTDDCDTDWALDLDVPMDFINDFSGSTTSMSGASLDCLDAGEVQPGTDVITIKRTAGEPTAYEGVMATGASAQEDQMYLKIEDYGDDKSWYHHGASGALPGLDPNNPTEYWQMYARVFYIRNYSTEAGDGIPTLCVRELMSDAISERCLVEGVENMQLAFGIDTDASPDSTPNQYLMDPNDLQSAVTARLYLLMRSVDDLAGSESASVKSFQLGLDPNTIDTSDGYLRRIFSTTVQMRNAILPDEG